MQNFLEHICERVAAFNEEILKIKTPERPIRLSEKRKDVSYHHLREEVLEFRDAETIEGEADALLDVLYLATGRLLEMGVCTKALFDLIHRANMQKVYGVSQKAFTNDNDAVKPAGWKHPNLSPLLEIGLYDLQTLLKKREPRKKPKLLIVGYARHGKDTACEFLTRHYGLAFTSSSLFCLKEVVFPALKGKYGYVTEGDCFKDRENHRAEWFGLISQYNEKDPARLVREVLKENDIYCGLRSKRELQAAKNEGLVDAIIWIDSSPRVPVEQEDSCTVAPWMANYVVDNNGTISEMECQLSLVMESIQASLDIGDSLLGV